VAKKDKNGAAVNILEVAGLNKHFGGLTACSNVVLHVERGEILGLIGPNGAGKTTTFNLVSGALTADSGTIVFKGCNIAGLKPHEITRMGIGRTFQSVKVFSKMSAFENVLLAHHFGKGKPSIKKDAKKETEEILEFVELSGMKDSRAMDLILADQKRLEVARALATNPDLLLLDEVMAGLTPTEVAQAMELVKRIRERGITILMIEHVMKAIMSICDRIMVLHHGEKIAEGTPKQIAASKRVIEVYLGEEAYAAS
jgi:branched-chain amino acid transport system ATP-binding protein